MKQSGMRGARSVIRRVFLADSAATDGSGKTGLTAFTVVKAFDSGTPVTAITEETTITTIGTYQAPTSNIHFRIKEMDATNFPGWYECHIFNAWLLDKARALYVNVAATGAVAARLEFVLDSEDTLVTGAASALAGDTVTIVDTTRTEADAKFNGAVLYLPGLQQTRYISDYDLATGVFTFFPAVAAAVPAGEVYEVIKNASFVNVFSMKADSLDNTAIKNAAISAAKFAGSAITNTVLAADSINSTVIAASAIDLATFATDAINKLTGVLVKGTASGAGTTTTLVDTALTDAADFWKVAFIYFPDSNEARKVTSFDAVADTVHFKPAIAAATALNDNYEIRIAPPVDLAMLDGDADAAVRIKRGANLIAVGSVNDISASSTVFVIALDIGTLPADDAWNTRTLTFESGARAGQSREISDYVNSTSTITLATALAGGAPADTDTFSIH